MEGAGQERRVDRRAARDRLRDAVPAERELTGPPEHGRRLPLPQRVGSRPGPLEGARDDLDSRRRQLRRLRGRPRPDDTRALVRRAVLRGQARRGRRDGQLPPRPLRLLCAPGARVGALARRQSRPARSAQGHAVGARQHRRVRRRQDQRDPLRRVGRIVGRLLPRGLAARHRPLRPGHQRERRVHRLDQRRQGPDL